VVFFVVVVFLVVVAFLAVDVEDLAVVVVFGL
jgi:hypothetical protein